MLQPRKPLNLSSANAILEKERKPLDLTSANAILKKKDKSESNTDSNLETGSLDSSKGKQSFRLPNDSEIPQESKEKIRQNSLKNKRDKSINPNLYDADSVGRELIPTEKTKKLRYEDTISYNDLVGNKPKKATTELLNSYDINTKVTEQEKKLKEQEADDEINVKGVWNKTKEFGIKALNFVSSNIAKMTDEPNLDKILEVSTDNLANYKEEYVKQLKDQHVDTSKLTKQEIFDGGRKLLIQEKQDKLKEDKATLYIDTLSDDEKEALNLDRIFKQSVLNQKDRVYLASTEVSKQKLETANSEMEDILAKFNNKEQLSVQEIEIAKNYEQNSKELVDDYNNNYLKYQKNTTELNDVDHDYDLLNRDYDITRKIIGKVIANVGRIGLGIASLENNLLNTNEEDRIAYGNQIAEKQAEIDYYLANEFQKNTEGWNGKKDAFEYVTDVIANQSANLALMAGTGGLGGLGAAVPLLSIGAYSTGNKINELTQSNNEGITFYTDKQISQYAFVSGAGEMLEMGTMGNLMRFNKFMRSSLTQPITRDLFLQASKNTMAKAFSTVPRSVAQENAEERGTMWIDILAKEKFLDVKTSKKEIADLTERTMKDTTTMSLLMSGAPQIAHIIIKPLLKKSVISDLDKNTKEIFRLNNELKKTNLTTEEVSIIKKSLDNKIADNKTILDNVVYINKNLNDEQRKKAIDLELSTSEIRAEARSVKKSTTIDEDLKTKLLNDLKTEYQKQEELRENIISGKTTILDVVSEDEKTKMKSEALNLLVSENEGTNQANYTNEVIEQKAVQIYNKEVTNQRNNVATEGVPQEVNTTNTDINVNDDFIPPAPPEGYNIVREDKPLNDATNIADFQEENTTTQNKQNDIDAEIERINNIEDLEEKKVAEIKFIMSNLFSNVGEASANKIKEYSDRIINGTETREQVIQGLPESFVKGIDSLLNANNPEAKPLVVEKTTTDTNAQPTEVEVAPSVSKTKTVTSKGFGSKESSYEVNFNDNGSIFEIRSASNGKIIPKFVERITKKIDKVNGGFVKILSRNGNYSKIEADALGELTENQSKKKSKEERNNTVSQALSNFVATNEYEAALEALARGEKVSKESIKKETGNKDSNWATNQFSSTELPSIEVLSEQISSNNPELDQTEIRNALIDIIGSNQNIEQVQDQIIDKYSENTKKLQEQELNAFLGTLTDKELSLYESNIVDEEFISELTDEDVIEYYKQKSLEYEQGEKATRETEGTNGIPIESAETNVDSIDAEQKREGEEKVNTEQASTQDRKSGLITERIKPDKKQPKNKPKKLPQIIKDVAVGLKATLIYGKSSRAGSLGTYNSSNALTRITRAGDIDTVAHELGHLLDDRFNIVGTIPSNALIKAIQELKWFSNRGGSNPPGNLSPAKKQLYLKREGLAEFIRAYIINPKQSEIIAPELFEHFNNTVSSENLDVLNKFSEDYLDYANASYGEQLISNVEDSNLSGKNGFREWLSRFKKEDGVFSITPFDSLNSHLFNSMTNAYKAFDFLTEKSGITDLLPEKNFEMLSRLFAGINGKTNSVLTNGMIDGKNNVIKDSQGNAMTINWLLNPLDSSSEKALREDMDETIKLLVAERTIEYATKFERLDNLTGIGAGVNSDIDVAQGYLNEFEILKTENKEKYTRIKDAAKRYREYADSGLKYAVDKGRISKESYKQIKETNKYYVSLARVNENAPTEEEVPFFNEMAGGLASVKDIIKKAKGGSKFIQNPYLSLVQNTVNIIKESDRNETLRSFVEPMNNIREMGDGTPVDFSQIARPAKEGDKNSKSIYIDGELQRWQFSQDVYNGITSMESEPDSTLVRLLSIPASVIRFTVTNFPTFALRNAVRDTQSRMIISRSNSGFKDLVHNSTDRELYELYGGSQAGFYLTNKDAYRERLTDSVKEITAKGGVVLDPRYLGRGYKKLLEKGESLNRIAEFKSSFKKAKNEGFDDYNSSLYAAYQSRDLMDFAVAGHTIRTLNKFIPFLNAGIQGLVRTKKSVQENPTGFAFRTAIYSVLPMVVFRSLVSQMGDDDEYEELPAHQRDLFYNFKTPATGAVWISIPKPFEQGMISSATDRLISKYKGYETAFDGFSGSLTKTLLPFDESSLLGGLKPIFEVGTNYNMFTDRPIISPFENGKMLELRKGIEKASRVSKTLQKGFSQVNWEVDPRNIDHLIKGYGTYMADWGLSFGDLGVEDSQFKFDVKKTGFAKDVPMSNSVSVNSVYKLATELGKWQDSGVKSLRKKIEKFYDEDDVEKRKLLSKEIFVKAKELKVKFEKEKSEISNKTKNKRATN